MSLGKAVNLKKKNGPTKTPDSEGTSDSQGEGEVSEMQRELTFSKIESDNAFSDE